MPITILPAVVEDVGPYADSDDSMSVDSDEDVEMGGVSLPNKRSVYKGTRKSAQELSHQEKWSQMIRNG